MSLTMTDLFCGAGGSSSGAIAVPGVTVRMAANHWSLAIETHNANHPATDHDCADVSQVDPRRYPRTDLLWASPECTNHSQARGRKRDDAQRDLFEETLPDEASERSRATMWDVVRFTEHHRYTAVVVENVVDAWHWAPFRAWLLAMDCLGYGHQVVWLNSMHAQGAGLPAPQSRDRMYVVFHRHGNHRPDVARWTRPRAWCPTCRTEVRAVQSWKRPDRPAWGRYRAQYLYRCPSSSCRHEVVEPAWLPAAAAIDWGLPGQRIGDRAKPLAEKTRRRIAAGLAKYARPVHLEHGGNQYDAADPKHPQHGQAGGYFRAWPVDEPLKVIHTAPTKALAYVPLMVPVEGRDGKTAAPVDDPLRTQTARNETALVVPLRSHNTAKLPSDPLDTVAAAGNHHALVMRNNGSRGDGGEHCTSPAEVIRTVTTAGHQSIVRWDHLVVDYNGPARPVTDALPTQTTVEGDALLAPAVEVDDCHFRMLEPHEIAAAMAFAPDYLLLGNKRERVRLCGNAVTPPAARDLIAAVAEAITGRAAP